MATYRNIIYRRAEHIGYVILNRPEAENALDRETADELALCCRAINEDETVRTVIITGNGGSFSIGDPALESADPLIPTTATEALAGVKAPVIAAINGDAFGSGLELALACDVRIAAEGASFGFPETSHGLIPSGGGTQRLPRIVGKGKALEMILTASIITAPEAYRIGLVNRIVPPTDLEKDSEALARKLASKGPIAERYAKEAILNGLEMTLGQGLRLEADLSFLLQSTRDRTEGIRAFLEKRPPIFKGE